MALEVEKKFELFKCEELDNFIRSSNVVGRKIIEQLYLAVTDNEEVRLRRTIDLVNNRTTHSITTKIGTGLVRQEHEVEITQKLFEELSAGSADKSIVEKNRTTILMSSGREVEVDIYYGKLDGLIIMEMELGEGEIQLADEITESLRELPFIIEDVTDDESYKNKNLFLYINSKE